MPSYIMLVKILFRKLLNVWLTVRFVLNILFKPAGRWVRPLKRFNRFD